MSNGSSEGTHYFLVFSRGKPFNHNVTVVQGSEVYDRRPSLNDYTVVYFAQTLLSVVK